MIYINIKTGKRYKLLHHGFYGQECQPVVVFEAIDTGCVKVLAAADFYNGSFTLKRDSAEIEARTEQRFTTLSPPPPIYPIET